MIQTIHRSGLCTATAIALCASVSGTSFAGPVEAHSHNLHALKVVLAGGDVDVHVLSDSIGLPVDTRYTTAFAWVLESLTGELPTRVGSGAGRFGNKRRFGMGLGFVTIPGLNEVSTQQTNPQFPYQTQDGSAPLVTGGQGSEMPHDGTISYGTMNGMAGTITGISANSSEQYGATTGGALTNVILPGLSNRVIADLFIHTGTDGLPNRLFQVQDFNRNGPVVASFNPSTDLAGYRHLNEDPSLPRGGAINAMIGRVLPEIRLTGQIPSNFTLRGIISDVERATSQSNAPVDDGTNLTFAGITMSRADENWQWVGGTAIYHHGGNSWDLDDWAISMLPDASEPKRFTDEQWLYAMDAWTADITRRSVYVLCIASENGGTVESVSAHAIAMMDRLTAADSAIGKPLPFFALIQWHRQGNLTEAVQRDWYQGYEAAAMTRPNAASLDVAGLLDYVVFDGSIQAQDYLGTQGLTSVTFGNVTNGDLSGADLVSDGVHQSGEIANAFFAQQVSNALLGTVCPGDCELSGEVDFNDLVAMLFEFGNADDGACDADQNGTIDFGDLVAGLFLFGPCS